MNGQGPRKGKTSKGPEGWMGQEATKILNHASHLNNPWISYKIKILDNEATKCHGKKVAQRKPLHICVYCMIKSSGTHRIKGPGGARPAKGL